MSVQGRTSLAATLAPGQPAPGPVAATPVQSRRWIPSLAGPTGWALAAAALLASVWIDTWAYRLAHAGKDAVEWRISYQLIRATGELWFWIPVGLAVGLARPGAWRRRVRAALWVFFAAMLAGVGAELLKVVVGRERPLLHDGSFVFRPLTGWLSNAGLSFPSSHAAVAFGGAWMIWRLAAGAGARWRTAGVAALALAAACGVSRMLTGAHFLGDIVGAGIVGAAGAIAVHRLITPGAARACPEVCLLRRRARHKARAHAAH